MPSTSVGGIIFMSKIMKFLCLQKTGSIKNYSYMSIFLPSVAVFKTCFSLQNVSL